MVGCWVDVFMCVFCLYPADPGFGLWCVCLAESFWFTLPILAVTGGVCVWVRVFFSPRQSWLGCWGVCDCVRALPVPHQSWLWSAVLVSGCRFELQSANPVWGDLVCVFVCAICLYPANPGCDIRCMCSGAGVGFSPKILAGKCGVFVCVCVLLPTRHSSLGCCCRCVCVCAGCCYAPPPLPWFCECCARFPGVSGTPWPLLLQPCPCDIVIPGGVPLWRASWPGAGASVSSGPVPLVSPVGFPVAVVRSPTGGLRPQIHWAAARDMWGPAENRVPGAYRWPPPRLGRLGCPASYPFGPRCGVVSGRSLWLWSQAAWAAVVRRVWRRSLTPRAPCHPPFNAVVGRCTWPVPCGRQALTFLAVRRHTEVL